MKDKIILGFITISVGALTALTVWIVKILL